MSNVFNSHAEMLLTSVGLTTEAMQERTLELARSAGRLSNLNVLRLADGWASFSPSDDVSAVSRLEQHTAGLTARTWTNRYLRHVLGRGATISTVRAGDANTETFTRRLQGADILLAPGGNTYQAMRGMRTHIKTIRDAVTQGLPYIGDSAGSIIAGRTLRPASLEPGDTDPGVPELADGRGLELIDADIVTHMAGRRDSFDVPGIHSAIASRMLRSFETPQSIVEDYVHARDVEGTETYVLHDNQALSVSAGQISLL